MSMCILTPRICTIIGVFYVNGLFIETIIVSHEQKPIEKSNMQVTESKGFSSLETFTEEILIWTLEVGKH